MCILNRSNFSFPPSGPDGHPQVAVALICPQNTCPWPRTPCQIPQGPQSCTSKDVRLQPHYHIVVLDPAERDLICGLMSWPGLRLSSSPWRCPVPGAEAASDPLDALLPGWGVGHILPRQPSTDPPGSQPLGSNWPTLCPDINIAKPIRPR